MTASPFAAIVARDLRLAARRRADAFLPIAFFTVAISLFPLGVGPEPQTLREILPICSYCRKIRDDENYWLTVEDYIGQNTATRFSHGICPHCLETHPELQHDEPGSA